MNVNRRYFLLGCAAWGGAIFAEGCLAKNTAYSPITDDYGFLADRFDNKFRILVLSDLNSQYAAILTRLLHICEQVGDRTFKGSLKFGVRGIEFIEV